MRLTRNSSRRLWPLLFPREHRLFEPRTIGILLLSFFLTLAIILFSNQFKSLSTIISPTDYEVGRVAERDITLDKDILYIDEEATRLRREAVEKLVPPVFRVNEEIGNSKLQNYADFRRALMRVLAEEKSLETVFLKLQLSFPGILKKTELERLRSYHRLEELLQQAATLLEQIYQTGLLRLPEQDQDLRSAGAVELWRWAEGKLEKESVLIKDVITRQSLRPWVQRQAKGLSEDYEQVLFGLVEAFAVENGFLDMEQMLRVRAKAVSEVEPVQAKLVKDQVIIRKGDIITEEAAVQIKALTEYSTNVSVSSIAGNAVFVLIVYGFCIFLMSWNASTAALRDNQILFLAGLGIIYLLLAAAFANFIQPPETVPLSVVLPTATIAMLVTLIISPTAGFVFSFIISLLLLPIVDLDLYTFLFAMITGLAGTAVVLRAQKRIDLIRAGIMLALISSVAMLAINLLRNFSILALLPALGWGLLNGFICALASLGFLPVFEHLLNTASRFRLIELSDLNAPILKRMLSLAPGTYNHSISVANLAESACSAMNANALLARVGAYYHDVGKIEQAEYFIENQNSYNKHDELKPSLSAAVIKSHVKMGIEKARELDLPAEVREIIAQHHGRGIIKYFYQRAMENEGTRNLPAEEYSYPGERPKTKEAAAVMLADAVEAASRTLRKPTIGKLEKVVWNIIMDKFVSNELGECELTLADLETIKKSFVQVLAGYFHSRIEYPKIKEALR